jgi:hypothetical protein
MRVRALLLPFPILILLETSFAFTLHHHDRRLVHFVRQEVGRSFGVRLGCVHTGEQISVDLEAVTSEFDGSWWMNTEKPQISIDAWGRIGEEERTHVGRGQTKEDDHAWSGSLPTL